MDKSLEITLTELKCSELKDVNLFFQKQIKLKNGDVSILVEKILNEYLIDNNLDPNLLKKEDIFNFFDQKDLKKNISIHILNICDIFKNKIEGQIIKINCIISEPLFEESKSSIEKANVRNLLFDYIKTVKLNAQIILMEDELSCLRSKISDKKLNITEISNITRQIQILIKKIKSFNLDREQIEEEKEFTPTKIYSKLNYIIDTFKKQFNIKNMNEFGEIFYSGLVSIRKDSSNNKLVEWPITAEMDFSLKRLKEEEKTMIVTFNRWCSTAAKKGVSGTGLIHSPQNLSKVNATLLTIFLNKTIPEISWDKKWFLKNTSVEEFKKLVQDNRNQ